MRYKVTPIIDPRRFEDYAAIGLEDRWPFDLTASELEEYSQTHRHFRVESVEEEENA